MGWVGLSENDDRTYFSSSFHLLFCQLKLSLVKYVYYLKREMMIRGQDYTPLMENRVGYRRMLILRYQVMLRLIRLIIMLEVTKPQLGLELVPVGIRSSRFVSIDLVWSYEV